MSSSNQDQAPARQIGIDLGRFAAIIAVILIHTAHESCFPKYAPGGVISAFGVDAGGILAQLSRFSVPFFFIASGYFFDSRQNLPISASLFHLLKRIGPLFLFWSIFYILLDKERLLWLSDPKHILEWLFNGGPGYHLWFLPSLIISLLLATWLRKTLSLRALLMLSGCLYPIGLVIGSYLPVFWSNPAPAWMSIARDSPCFGLVFVASGMWFAANPTPRMQTAILTSLAGATLQLAEALWLDANQATAFYRNDFLLGTLPFGVAVFAITLNWRPVSIPSRFLAQIGQYSFGIYAMHVFFIKAAAFVIHPVNLSQRLFVASFALIASGGLALLMARDPRLQRLIR